LCDYEVGKNVRRPWCWTPRGQKYLIDTHKYLELNREKRRPSYELLGEVKKVAAFFGGLSSVGGFH
jgi:hypothetical protein